MVAATALSLCANRVLTDCVQQPVSESVVTSKRDSEQENSDLEEKITVFFLVPLLTIYPSMLKTEVLEAKKSDASQPSSSSFVQNNDKRKERLFFGRLLFR